MKKIILHLILSSVCISMYAYEPMLVKGRMWTNAVICDFWFEGYSENYSDSTIIVGDTIIEDKVYYKFSRGGRLMHEDINANEVYIRKEGEDFLIYKFNLQMGDTLFNNNLIDQKYAPIDLVVDSVYTYDGHKAIKLHPVLADTMNVGNYGYEFLDLINDDTFDSFYREIIWIEGVGDMQSAFHRRIWDYGRVGGYCSEHLYCVTDIDSTYYPSSRDKSACYIPYTYSGISNNMTNKSLEVSLSNNTLEVVTPDNETIYSTSLFDITGRKVYLCNSSSTHHELTLPHGIYCIVVQTQNKIYSTKVIKQ